MRKEIENKTYDFIKKHGREIEVISRNTIIHNNKEKETKIKFVLNGVPIAVSDDGIYLQGKYTPNLYEIPSFEELEKIFCNKSMTKEEILCENIRNVTSRHLENAIANKDTHEMGLETLGLVIDDLVDYIGNK